MASSKNNELNKPSALAEARIRVFFFICLLGCSDWFSWLLDAASQLKDKT
jgi:hypothetical protein